MKRLDVLFFYIFWAQADVLGSPDHQILFFVVATFKVSVKTILAFFFFFKSSLRKNGENNI